MCASRVSRIVINPRQLYRRGALAVLLCVFSASSLATGAGEAQSWLERLSKAVRERNYQGTFVYRHEGNMETLRVIHRAGPDGEMERLYSLTGSPREIIRDNQKVTCILPDDRSVMVDSRQLASPLATVVPGDIGELAETYRFELMGDGRIANRDAKQVGIFPEDGYRYGYRLWIDEATALLLRADLFDEKGEVVEQLVFTELSTPQSIPTSELQPQISGEGFTWHRNVGQGPAVKPADLRWRAPGMPKGFELVLHEVRPLPGKEGAVEHMLYSDGLASVSVYIESAGPGESFSGHSRVGALNAYGRVVDGHQTTVVGEVPAATVSRVGESLRLGAPAGR